MCEEPISRQEVKDGDLVDTVDDTNQQKRGTDW